MSLLAPMALALLGLLPVILLLYFLKLKRREEPISSTFLWRRAIEDLRVNSPFQRLRKNLLLWLQLALLALLILGLSRPAFRARPGTGRRYICLIDTSASMAATDVAPSRLEKAKREALRLVADLSRDDQMMLMTFDCRPAVVVPFTDSKARLREAIRGIETRETATDFDTLVEDIKALAEGRPNLRVFLISDGAFPVTSPDEAPAVDLSFVRIGRASANVGITALDARRSLEDWDQPQIFARVENVGPEAATVRLDLYLNGGLFDARTLTVPTGKGVSPPDVKGSDPFSGTGEAAAVFSDPNLNEGLVRVVLSEKDDLVVDNEAWLVLTRPRKARVLVVTPGNFFLELALRKDPVCAPVSMSPETFDAQLKAGTLSLADYDLTIFDRHAPPSLPAGSHLFLGAVPPIEGFRSKGTTSRPAVIDWDPMHPVNDHVTYANLFLAQAMQVAGPLGSRVLVEGETGPLILGWTSPTHRVVVVGFDMFESRWPLRPAFPIFLANAVRYLGGVHLSGEAARIRPGSPIAFQAPQAVREVRVTRPDGTLVTVPVRAGAVRFDDTHTCGPYTFDLGQDRRKTFVVNLLDSRESNIAPREAIQWREARVTGTTKALKENREIWPWLALAALTILMVEWYIYNRRVYV